MSAPIAQRIQLDGLTIARGLAAWLVVLFHIRSGMPWLPETVHTIIDKGYLAVDFFFLLSGFVIYLSAHKVMLDDGMAAILAFLRRRFARIYPLHAVILGATVLFVLLLTATGRDTSGYPWWELPLHITLTQNWGFTEQLSWNHPAWSISTEFAAYLFFPVIILATPITRAPRWLLACGMMASIAIMAAYLYLSGLTILGATIAKYGLIRCLFEFSAGTMLCAFWLQCQGKSEKWPFITAILLCAASAILWASHAANELWAFPTIAVCSIFLIAQASRHYNAEAASPPVRALLYIGEISYATYLAHFMLFIWFKIALVEKATNIPPWQVALFLMLTLLASVLLYHGVEKPGRRILGKPGFSFRKSNTPRVRT